MPSDFPTRATVVVAAAAITASIFSTLAEVGHPHPDGYWALAMKGQSVAAPQLEALAALPQQDE